jgi:thioester reductase-like protein
MLFISIEQVDIIYHCGAQVNWILPYSQLRLPNFCGTVEIVQLATQSRLKHIHCIHLKITVAYKRDISTLGIAGKEEGSYVSETELLSLNAYSLTKYAAEKFLDKAVLEGLNVTFYRPGMITGSSNTGKCCILCLIKLL